MEASPFLALYIASNYMKGSQECIAFDHIDKLLTLLAINNLSTLPPKFGIDLIGTDNLHLDYN